MGTMLSILVRVSFINDKMDEGRKKRRVIKSPLMVMIRIISLQHFSKKRTKECVRK